MRSFSSGPPLNYSNFYPGFQLQGRTSARKSSVVVLGRNGDSSPTEDRQQQRQQLNLSVLRFTFGIRGLDESYLPRWIGYGFGSLLVLNHFLGSSPAPAQLRTEALGLSLAAFSIALPYVGRFLKGASPMERATLPEGVEQIFVMSQDIPDTLKEELAWATYVLLRNTNTVAVLIANQGALCVRGYWNTPQDVSREQLTDWFAKQIGTCGIVELKDSLYFSQPAENVIVIYSSESGLWDLVPKGTRSLLLEPVLRANGQSVNEIKAEGFILLTSSLGYAYNDKDRAWIRAVANKFRGAVLYSKP